MARLIQLPILLNVAIAAAIAVVSPGGTGMRPCKRCSDARLSSRDELLYKEDGDLIRMKEKLAKEVEDLEDQVKVIKKKNGLELGKLNKRLKDMSGAYTKFGKDSVARTAKFAKVKAKASADLDKSLSSTDTAHKEVAKLHASMDELRKYLNPYVNKLISGKGWPMGCKCPGAKALLQRLEAKIQLASLDIDGDSDEDSKRSQALLSKAAKLEKPIDQEKYKLVRAVQQLEEKRAKLTREKTEAITGFSEEQRRTLDRINVASTKAKLKATTERKYKDNDDDLEKNLKAQIDAAKAYEDSAKSQLARMKKNEAACMKDFATFKAELQKCKCI